MNIICQLLVLFRLFFTWLRCVFTCLWVCFCSPTGNHRLTFLEFVLCELCVLRGYQFVWRLPCLYSSFVSVFVEIPQLTGKLTLMHCIPAESSPPQQIPIIQQKPIRLVLNFRHNL